ncbi:MAG: hypothetical protein JW768_12100 [Chitinispirillaceae bacterium]|nr:hypothetical protein [Chitinispirillaceae bacterium]
MSELRSTIRELSDQELATQYLHHKEDYTPEALAIMKEEMDARQLDQSAAADAAGGVQEDLPELSFKSEDFVRFDHSFSRTDLLLASAMLREHAVPFFVDNPTSTETIPIESELEKRYTLNIPKPFIEKAHELLDEHFVKADNRYLLKYSGARDRLKAFNFHDIHLTESESFEEVQVTLAQEERQTVVSLGRRLLGEAEAVEQAQERVLFYYDSIEPLIARLQAPGTSSLTKNDLLAILEILQVYVDDPALPASMDEAIVQLLDLFIGS